MSSPEKSAASTNEFATYIDELIEKLQSKVNGVNTELDSKFEDMNSRIDKLEQTINSILQQKEEEQPSSES
ncbi:hypothetical protein BJV82DRAFT_638148 [Fennellomyces sp. T-0311]|nr:hypothetical protein BJV82DRAFT_638148 [Fennellomyces sp. T-0311]